MIISNFEELLKKNHSVTIHIRNIQLLAIEMNKLKNNLSLDIITWLFPRNEYSYNMRNCLDFMRPNPKTVRWGTESLTNLGPIIWDIVPTDIKSLPTLHSLKQRIKQWDPQNCPCRLCKVYVGVSCDLYFVAVYCGLNFCIYLTFHVMFLLYRPK